MEKLVDELAKLAKDELNLTPQGQIDAAKGRGDCLKRLALQQPDNESYMLGYHLQACKNYLDEVEEAKKYQ